MLKLIFYLCICRFIYSLFFPLAFLCLKLCLWVYLCLCVCFVSIYISVIMCMFMCSFFVLVCICVYVCVPVYLYMVKTQWLYASACFSLFTCVCFLFSGSERENYCGIEALLIPFCWLMCLLVFVWVCEDVYLYVGYLYLILILVFYVLGSFICVNLHKYKFV